jgi:lon-related putative ATP-dependent protease
MAKARPVKEVPLKELRWQCDPKSLGVQSTNEVRPTKEIIGQERALKALRLGLEMKHPGYNVFVTGFSGTGRMTTIKRMLSELQERTSTLFDRCYVHNFKNPDQPILLTLSAGEGSGFRQAMRDLISELLKNIPAAFDRKRYKDERKRTMELFQARQQSVLHDFESKVKEKGFEVIQVQSGPGVRPDITPVVNGQPVGFDQLEALLKQGQVTKEQIEQFSKDRVALEMQMESVFRELHNIERKARESMNELAQRYILPIIKESIDEVRSSFTNEKLHSYLDSVQDDILENLTRFRPRDEHAQSSPILEMAGMQAEEDNFLEYQVNVVVDNSQTKGVPIVIETNPKFKNIFGTIERQVDRNGIWRTDFTLIKPGSLLEADGGYLVINALDALVEPGVWQALKRTLRNGLLEIQPLETGLFGASSAFKPESIEINVKVIMLGDADIYFLLYEQDDDFKKIFKIRADFDIVMPKQPQSLRRYVNFIKMICDDENLAPFESTGIASVIEHGVRLAGRQDKLSTRFNLIADLLREASYWARKQQSRLVTNNHVAKAVEERIERVRLTEEKLLEVIKDGTIMIDTDGAVVGQVNGLSVYDMHEYMFGLPTRITAKTSIGREGIINIEREALMSGPTHNKGVLIISGYLHAMYAQRFPLTMNASITFEQSYGGVDGDSASSTEIYAILSSLADAPLRQDIAVTGSVNQKGEIQPIGGVNQKIEWFFTVCKSRGLTGSQGVLIPHQNKKDLMLKEELIDAIAAGKFHIYAIKSIDEGLELLTGLPAGNRRKDGLFDSGSLHFLVEQTLRQYAQHWKEMLNL